MVDATKLKPTSILVALLLMAGATLAPISTAATQASLILLAENSLISKDQAIAIAKRRQKGKVLSAQLIKKTPPVYRVKMLTPQGRVTFISVAAYRKSKG